MQALTPGVDGPSIREWYRFLNCGFRLPVVGGTDKMSAEIPLGAIRTYARLDPGAPISFEAWADAVRAGRTFVSSGPFVEVEVDGCGPGDVVQLGRGGGTVEVRALASAAQPVIDGIELIHDGVVVAAAPRAGPSGRASRSASHREERLAGRPGHQSRADPLRLRHGMGAHSSPVYLDVPGEPAFAADDAAAIGTIIDGARTWVEGSPRSAHLRNERGWPPTWRRVGRRSTTSSGSARAPDEASPQRLEDGAVRARYSIVRTFSKGWPSASGPIVE